MESNALEKSTNESIASRFILDGTLTGNTTLGQSGPGINGNKEVLHTLQTSSLLSYPRYHSFGDLTLLQGIQSVYFKLCQLSGRTKRLYIDL